MSLQSVFDVLTNKWQSREEIERLVGEPCMSQLILLRGQGRVLHMIDATQGRFVHKFARRHKLPDVLIGTGQRRCAECPFMEAAE